MTSARTALAPDRPRLTAAQGRAVRSTVMALKGTEFEPWAQAMSSALAVSAPTVPSAVVVGEVKRGKSTLVNAILGQPDLVPAGLGVVTAGFVRVGPPTDDLVEGQARVHLADGTTRQVGLAAAREVAVTGSTGSEGDAAFVGISIAHDSEVLPGVALVDTPGIAGLTQGHAELAALAASQGSVLVVVTDAGQVLTRPELEFLTEVSAKVEQVVFALTKIDQYPSGWEEVMAENRDLLRRHAPRFAEAPICPVSATVALEVAALEQGGLDPGEAADLREYAGLDVLAAAIRERLVSPASIAVANALRSGLSGIERYEEKRRRTIEALESAGQQVPELDALVQRLRGLQEQGDRWSLDLNSDSSVLRADVLHRASQQLAAVRQQWVAVAHERRSDNPEKVVEEVALALTAQLRAIVTGAIGEFTDGFQGQAEQLFGSIGRDLATAVRLDPDVDDLAMAEVAEAEYSGSFDATLASTAMIGSSMGGLVAGLIAPAIIAPVFSIVGGAAWYLVNYRARRAHNLERLVTQTAATAVNRAETHLRFAVDRARTVMLRDVTIAFRHELKAALDSAKTELEAARRSAAETPERLRREVANETRHLEALRAQREELQAVMDEALRRRPATAARTDQEGSGTNPSPAPSET
ncbi:MAG: dynamin family protein [Aeromicrobium sp.]|uniref:dynamin family protein n=1 Tax=Aeromicrobium sp. TaxID=1871063 RepID=UPI0026310413|nr:dynamin family protein [Aeromicrobium sp.]MDF1704172.1 dynamin family protein [Aeromicrobium sp.]